jgi:competence protein ComEA
MPSKPSSSFPSSDFSPLEQDFRDSHPAFSLEHLIETHRLPLGFALAGLLFIGIGLLVWRSQGEANQIEIIPATASVTVSPTASLALAIDIAGAVQKPGLYHLSSNARVEDALVAAGGLSSEAHRDWVAQHLNRARKLADGEKLYVPFASETSFPTSNNVAGATTSAPSAISINTASQPQLESLWGIGPVTSQAIIDNRPYNSLNELLDRKIVKSNVWERIKDQLAL